MSMNILSNRPSGASQTDIKISGISKNKVKLGKKTLNINPSSFAMLIGGLLILLGFTPIILHLLNPNFDISFSFEDGFLPGNNPDAEIHFLDYHDIYFESTKQTLNLGPFGVGATIISLLIPLGMGLALGLYYKLRSGDVIKMREDSKKLELQFSSALFQLGNRLSDGYPAELVFDKVGWLMKDTISGKFFLDVANNIKNLGMSVEQAIFDPDKGAINKYPSALIESSMKVLTQSVKKGPLIAAQAMANVARYIKEIHSVNERLKDLMAEVTSSINSQIKFLAPSISGIVVGITSMITLIIGRLSHQMTKLQTGQSGNLMTYFKAILPTFHFQIIVGIYVVQLAFILTQLLNGIENGNDKIFGRYLLGINIIKSTKLYIIISLVVIVLFSIVGSSILGSTATPGR